MSEYTPFSHIISSEDSQFNEIWDESTGSSPEDEKKEKPKPDPPAKNSPPVPAPVLKPSIKKKPKREEVAISTVTVEEQSVASSISKGSFVMGCQKTRLNGMCTSAFESFDGEKALRIPTCVSERVPSCVGEEAVLKNVSDEVVQVPINGKVAKVTSSDEVVKVTGSDDDAFSPSLFQELNDFVDEIEKTPNQEKNQGKAKKQGTANATKSTGAAPKKAGKYTTCNCFDEAEPVTSIAELLASAAFHFKSSPLSFVDDCSIVSKVYKKAMGKCPKEIITVKKAPAELEKTPTEISHILSDITSETPTATIEEKRLDDRNLLDSLLPETPSESQGLEASENPVEGPSENTLEEENVTEGLGLQLPPASSNLETEEPQDTNLEPTSTLAPDSPDTNLVPVVESPDTNLVPVAESPDTNLESVAKSPDTNLESVAKSPDTNLESVAESPDTKLTSVPESYSTEEPKETSPATGEADISVDSSSYRDVYITYRIEDSKSNYARSESQFSETSTTPILTPKQSSGRKPFSMPRWGKMMKKRNKDKKKTKTRKNGVAKPTTSICDSPGSATVGTAETAMSMVTYATISFGEDHPANPRKVPFLLRPRSKTKKA